MTYSYRTVFVRLAVFTLALLTATAGMTAEVYKWVDAKGRTHFGDKPPESGAGVTRIETATRPAPAAAADADARLKKQQKLLDAFSSERKERASKRSEARRKTARLKRNCAVARSNLAKLERANLLYRKDKEGNRQYASEAQKAKLIERYKTVIKKHCRSG